MLRSIKLLFVLFMAGGLPAVSGMVLYQESLPEHNLAATLSATPEAVIQAAATVPTATLSPTQLVTNMVIWWPEPLSPLDNTEAAALLDNQINDFQASQGNVVVDLRLKKVSGVGGIMSTLRAASPVAPGALPDLTLVRREDLLAAAQAGLIYPLEGAISSAILGDLYPSALALGQIDGELYGLPYMVEVQHMANQPREGEQPSSRFEDILADALSFALPAAQTAQINGILLTQYIDAGGALPDSDGGEININALSDTLRFYEQAVALNLIDSAVLNYTSTADYEAALTSGALDAAVVNSTDYLRLIESGEVLDFAPVPTNSGALLGEADSWMWVMTTSSADRQALAARFLNWMLNVTRQGEYSRTVMMIPSQRTALQTWENSSYVDFVRELLNNALLPLSDDEGGTIARAMQNALVAVLSGERTAVEATADLIDRLQD